MSAEVVRARPAPERGRAAPGLHPYAQVVTQIAAPPRTNTLALVGFIGAFLIPIAGLVLGVMATRQLRVPGTLETGRGLARWAIAIGLLGSLFQAGFLIIWLSLFSTAVTGGTVGA